MLNTPDAASVLVEVAEVIATAKSTYGTTGNSTLIWQTQTDENDRPFRTWGAYVADRLAPWPIFSKEISRQIAKVLLSEGMSIREVAKATKLSKDTVNRLRIKNANARVSSKTPREIARKSARQAVAAITEATDLVPDMSSHDVVLLLETLTNATVLLRSHCKARPEEDPLAWLVQ